MEEIMEEVMTDAQFKRSFAQAGGWFILCALEELIAYKKLYYHEKGSRREMEEKIAQKYGRELSTMAYRIKHARKIIKHKRHKEAVEKARDSTKLNRIYPQAREVAERLLLKIEQGKL